MLLISLFYMWLFFFPAPFIEKTLFPIVYSCLLCHVVITNAWVYFWDLYSAPLIYVSVFVPVLTPFDYCIFVLQSKVREHISSSVLLFTKRPWLDRVFCNSKSILRSFFPVLRNVMEYFDRERIFDCLEYYGHFNYFSHPQIDSICLFQFVLFIQPLAFGQQIHSISIIIDL